MRKLSSKLWVAAALLALTVAGCGGGEDATPTPAPTATAAPAAPATATPAEANTASEPVSPLAEPVSPLSQPPSPLPAGEATGEATAAAVQGPHIGIAVPADINAITELAGETEAPTPQEGMAALSGVLYSPVVNRIIPGTQFYLTPAIEQDGQLHIPTLFEGPKEAEGDIIGISNDQGQILLDNIPPGNYYMPVWTIYDWPLAFGGKDEKLPLLITVEAGEQLDLGLLYVQWP